MVNVVIRSFDSLYDPRTNQIRDAFHAIDEDCLILDWSIELPPKQVVRFAHERLLGRGARETLAFLKFNWWLLKWLLHANPKNIVCVDLETFLGPALYKCLSILRRKKITLVFDVADSLASKVQIPCITPFISWLEKCAFAFSDYVVFPSVNRIPKAMKSKYRVVENVFLSQSVISELKSNEKKVNTIFYGGLLLRDRGIESLLSLARFSDFQIIIAGYGELENRVIHFASENPNVKFLGKREFMELAALRAQCEFSWCWYEQNKLENRNHASGKILESIQVGSIPITNVSPKSLPYLSGDQEEMVLFVTQENLHEKIMNFERDTIQNVNMSTKRTTCDRYIPILEEIGA